MRGNCRETPVDVFEADDILHSEQKHSQQMQLQAEMNNILLNEWTIFRHGHGNYSKSSKASFG